MFSIEFEEPEFSVLPHAAAVAKHFGTVHTKLIVTSVPANDMDAQIHCYDEPFTDASAIPTIAIARIAANHTKVVLSGDGGVQQLGGYSHCSHDLRKAAIRDRLPLWLRNTCCGRSRLSGERPTGFPHRCD